MESTARSRKSIGKTELALGNERGPHTRPFGRGHCNGVVFSSTFSVWQSRPAWG